MPLPKIEIAYTMVINTRRPWSSLTDEDRNRIIGRYRRGPVRIMRSEPANVAGRPGLTAIRVWFIDAEVPA